jgi:hypothetical protein
MRPTDSDPDPPTSAELVSRVAHDARQRQEETRTAAQRPQPDFLLDVEQSEVGYTLPPRLLPLSFIDYERFAAALFERWGVHPDWSKVRVDPAALQGLRQREDFDKALIEHVLRGSSPEVRFVSGAYRVSEFDFVPINTIRVNHETAQVSVRGHSAVAESVAKEVIELVSASAGASRAWGNIEPHVQVAGYATRTRIKLAGQGSFEEMLRPEVQKFLAGQVAEGPKYGAHTGKYLARHGLQPPPKAQVTVALDELHLLVTCFDPDTGDATQTKLTFSVTQRADYGSGIVSVYSELPYEQHIAMLGALRTAMNAPSG